MHTNRFTVKISPPEYPESSRHLVNRFYFLAAIIEEVIKVFAGVANQCDDLERLWNVLIHEDRVECYLSSIETSSNETLAVSSIVKVTESAFEIEGKTLSPNTVALRLVEELYPDFLCCRAA